MINIDVSKESPLWDDGMLGATDKILYSTVEAALKHVPALKGFDLDISIVLADNPFVQKLNKTYRFKDKPTNVLSFPQIDWTQPPHAGETVILGDIILAYETIKAEAVEQEKTFLNHLQHLLVHGTLHLCGYDHEDDEEAEIMEKLEIVILSELGIKNPYQDGR